MEKEVTQMAQILYEKSFGTSVLKVLFGNIVEEATDAIVNPSNSSLLLGGGVAGAIRTAGGPEIQSECNKIGHCNVGDAVITTAGSLKSKWVIHAVGPVYSEYPPKEAERLLRSAIRAVFKIMSEKGLQSVTFPLISAGIFGYPFDEAIKVHLEEMQEFATLSPEKRVIQLILYPKANADYFSEHIKPRLR